MPGANVTVRSLAHLHRSGRGTLGARQHPGVAMRSPVRRPMYPQPWQRWVWAALPAVSAATLTFVPFIVAWRRRVVGWRTLAVYTALSGILIAGAVTDFDFRQWGTFWREVIRYTHWAYLITGVVHVALLDWPRERHEVAKG